ncbi:MAG: hypothetical protein KatS3mg085_173 [Candidatus Dojkabacteria bacterium]|nr:MAG: hypothetical protein KatS3mg085_173 [Candidatus Dojkabacteria bacterium]
MKLSLISFILGIFFAGLTYYFYSYESPFKQEKLQEIIEFREIEPNEKNLLQAEISFIIEKGLVFEYLSTNAYLALACLNLSIVSVFLSLHLIIDKLFFKTLIDPPNYSLAFRRSIVFLVALVLFFYFKLQAVEFPALLLTFVIAIILEYLFESYLGRKSKLEPK